MALLVNCERYTLRCVGLPILAGIQDSTRPVPAGRVTVDVLRVRLGTDTTSVGTGIHSFMCKEHDYSRFQSYMECFFVFY